MQSVATRNQENADPHQNPLEINQHDKFFTRIMSKDTSTFNSSCRVYYGGASGSVPFMWESRPGTPKHTLFSDTFNIPPLTPPPSYFSSKSESMEKPNYNLLSAIFPRLTNLRKKNHVTPSSSMSSTATIASSLYSSSSSSSSSVSSFYSPPLNSKFQRQRFLPCSRSPIHFTIDGDCDNNHGDHKKTRHRRMPLDSTLCYNIVKRKAFQGRNLMNNMKNKFLSMVGRGSS